MDQLAALRAGDEGAFAALVRRWHVPLTRFARAYVASDAVAEDVAQETWLAAIRGLDGFEGRSSVSTWLFSIARNIARSRGVAESKVVPLSALAVDDEPAVDPARFEADGPWRGHWVQPPPRWPEPLDEAVAAELAAAVRAAIQQLPAVQRAVITLRDVEGMPGPEVAELLDLSEGNQRVLLHRARAKVRAALADLLEEAG